MSNEGKQRNDGPAEGIGKKIQNGKLNKSFLIFFFNDIFCPENLIGFCLLQRLFFLETFFYFCSFKPKWFLAKSNNRRFSKMFEIYIKFMLAWRRGPMKISCTIILVGIKNVDYSFYDVCFSGLPNQNLNFFQSNRCSPETKHILKSDRLLIRLELLIFY